LHSDDATLAQGPLIDGGRSICGAVATRGGGEGLQGWKFRLWRITAIAEKLQRKGVGDFRV
jgi:hypothetical protein